MIKKLSFVTVFILCFCTISVSAQDAGDGSPSQTSKLDQRVTERLKRLKTETNDKQLQTIKAKCKTAQTKFKIIKKTATFYFSAQDERVSKILDDLDKLTENLKNQRLDTESIDKNAEEIKQLKTEIDSTYEKYLLAIEDAAIIDCEASPEGFRISVDDAKKQFSELQELRKSLTDIIRGNLKSALINLKDSL
jgi:hypothetical protein